MARIIGITGKAGSGKDTLAKAIAVSQRFQEAHPGGIHIIAFADTLKQYVMVKFGLTRDDVYTQEGKSRVIPWLGVTVREVLQKEGTELTRDAWLQSFWAERLKQKVAAMHPTELVIVPDVRFDDEADWILDSFGFLVGIEGREQEGLEGEEGGHRSEAGIDKSKIHAVVENTGTLRDLQQTVPGLLTISQAIFAENRRV